MQLQCYKCSKVFEMDTRKVSRQDRCFHCGIEVKVCKMCKHYEPSAYNECREAIAERIVDKEKANFCELFEPGVPGAKSYEKDKLLSAAELLFKKK